MLNTNDSVKENINCEYSMKQLSLFIVSTLKVIWVNHIDVLAHSNIGALH
jgi:hypothetical protein